MAKKTKTPVGEVPDISEYVRAAAEHPLVRRVVEDADCGRTSAMRSSAAVMHTLV